MIDTTFIWKIVAGLILAVLLMAAGAALDHHYFVKPIEAKQNQQAGATIQASADAIAENKQIKEKQDAQTQQAGANYDAVKSRLAVGLQRRTSAGDKSVSAFAIGTRIAAAPSVQPCGVGTDIGIESCTVSGVFYDNALNDAAAVDGWGDWADRQGFPTP